MCNVVIYADLNRNFQGDYDLIVKRIDDYVDSYVKIKKAINENKKLIVVVQNRYCIQYFQEMISIYGQKYIIIRETSPRRTLAEVLKIDIPSYITNEDIVADQLITKVDQLHFTKGMNFSDLILRSYIGVYFTYDKFPIMQLKEFLLNTDYKMFNKKLNESIVRKVYKNKLENWIKNSQEEQEKIIIKMFVKDPKELLDKYCKFLILKNYPYELGHDVLGDDVNYFNKFKFQDNPFIFKGLDTLELQRNLKIFLNQLRKDQLSKEDIQKYLGMVCGLLQEEFDFILSVIEQNISEVNKELIDTVKVKFETYLSSNTKFLDKLNNIIPPSFPSEPREDYTITQWLEWAINQYLPYRFWLEENDQYDFILDKYSSQYGDWIFKNYHQLLSNEPNMLHKTLINLNEALTQDEVSIIVIVDNYNFKYVPLVKEYFNHYGFSTSLEKPIISLIPTETSVSKSAFFNAEPYSSKNKSYDKRCSEWETYFDKKVKYLSDISKLDEIKEKKENIYILNYVSIDKILHESQSNSALPISYRIQEELKAMIDKVVEFSKSIGYESEMKIYFTSDHGSTKIFSKQHNLIDSKYYKEKADDAAHRYIALKDKEFKIYKDSIGQLCYAMDRQQYGTKENFLIARNYYRFINTDGSFYVHGGITPEENIVPLLKFEKISANLQEPNLILRNNEFRYSVLSNMTFTIKNYNEYELKNIEIMILNPNIKWDQKSCKIEKVRKESEVQIDLSNFRIMKAKGDTELNVRLVYSFLGKKYETDYKFNIKIKSIQENKINLDDLF